MTITELKNKEEKEIEEITKALRDQKMNEREIEKEIDSEEES